MVQIDLAMLIAILDAGEVLHDINSLANILPVKYLSEHPESLQKDIASCVATALRKSLRPPVH
jgi:hypothetical protein